MKEHQTHTIDATDKIVGRVASQVARWLMGKHRRTYTPNIEGSDFVVVQNVRNIKTSGNKLGQKEYKHYSGYPGGLKKIKWSTLFEADPKKLLWLAVYRVLPKNRMRAKMIKRLKIE